MLPPHFFCFWNLYPHIYQGVQSCNGFSYKCPDLQRRRASQGCLRPSQRISYYCSEQNMFQALLSTMVVGWGFLYYSIFTLPTFDPFFRSLPRHTWQFHFIWELEKVTIQTKNCPKDMLALGLCRGVKSFIPRKHSHLDKLCPYPTSHPSSP